MGLYINGDYEDIYQSDEAVNDNNQVIYVHDRASERLKEQEDFNVSTREHLAGMKASADREYIRNRQKWEEFEADYGNILAKLTAISKENEQLSNQVTAYLRSQEEITKRFAIDQTKMEDLKKRMEEQEALTAKVVRQLDHFRSILYERTNYLAEKVGEATTTILQFLKSESSSSKTKDKEKITQ
ncbi:hypothetical protein [Oceanobacillus alkalisoli]|uniref:hypothetical protein n=1 Tax=Oceanobacillus alkalisoli TaxID=2925113 RepID=UPI001F11EF19|nr:hypothetical protein [Oceanobacillus alkalisoli]MCF3942127.1 hypothetical protein [Oceanobacillus alkalisoli]